ENLQPEMAERLKNLHISDFPSEGNFATFIRCYLVAPQTGEYTFFITSDDSSRLWLSTSEDPAGKKKIAFVDGRSDAGVWDARPGQKSKPVKLEKSKKYYMEVVHIEGGGGSHLAVGWEMPDKTMERPVPIERLEFYEPPEISPRTAAKIDFPKAKIVRMHKIGNVKLDGDLAEWQKIPSMPLPFMNKTESSVRLAWREDGVYGAVQAKDDNVRADERNPWIGDCLELWIDKDCSRVADRDKPNKAAQYVFAPSSNGTGGNGVTAIGWGSEIDTKDNLQCAWKKTSDGYSLEFFIPARVLEPAKMQVGAMMGLNFALDNNGKAMEQFFRDKDVENAYRRPALWGVVELAE
ncbi:MAG: hypothetical protein HZA50_12020, partial [Planctomycetes bacterium]|nr:hypothetical protein [Planctomycetota bacterium]